MLVVDASVVIELLVGEDAAEIERRVRGADLVAPHLIDAEVPQVLRRFVRAGALSPERAELALADLSALSIERYAHEPLVGRAWELRNNLTIYDALYVALSEAADAPLLTRDAALGRAPGVRATVEVL